MERIRHFFARSVLLVLALGAATALAQTIPGTAARVNGEEISNFRLEKHFDDYVKNKGRNITKMINPKVYKKLKREALDELIDQEVLWQAARDAKVFASDEEVAAAMTQFKAGFKTPEAYKRKLELNGFDEKSYTEYVRRQLSGYKNLSQVVGTPAVSDEEVAAYYRENPQRFSKPETVRARHILVKVEQGADAKAKEEARRRAALILADVRKGQDFAVLAERFSEDPSGRNSGGDLGDFARGQMVPSFEAVAFTLEPGKVSDLVETEYGFHIIKVEARTPASTVPLDEVKDKIRAAILAQKRSEGAKKSVEQMRALAKVEILVNLAD